MLVENETSVDVIWRRGTDAMNTDLFRCLLGPRAIRERNEERRERGDGREMRERGGIGRERGEREKWGKGFTQETKECQKGNVSCTGLHNFSPVCD